MFKKADSQGYLVYVNIELEGISTIWNETIIDKIPVFGVSFLLMILTSLLISHFISKRIKRIDQKTQEITQQNFDVLLDDSSQDELGTLSHNINIMSQTLKKTIDDLNEEIKQVKHLESVKSEFLANFTHEIKTPLAIMNGYIELIGETNDSIKRQEYLHSIEKEVHRIDELVKAMLNLSQLESGNMELHIQDIDLDELMTSVIDSLSSLIQRKHLHLEIEGENGMIKADPFEFEIVIQNFLSNAIKHTPEGQTIYIHYDPKTFSIENEGSSLTEEQMIHIWETYVSSDREGTGLGLAICRSILDLHGFEYRVENTERGVCFQIQIRV